MPGQGTHLLSDAGVVEEFCRHWGRLQPVSAFMLDLEPTAEEAVAKGPLANMQNPSVQPSSRKRPSREYGETYVPSAALLENTNLV